MRWAHNGPVLGARTQVNVDALTVTTIPEDEVRASPVVASSRAVFEENAPFVGRALRYLGVADADLEDACQEVFVVVHRKLPSFAARSAFRTWLYGICVRVAWRFRRRSSRRREAPIESAPEPVMAASQEDDLGRREARELLRALLDELDEPKRAVFVLYEIEELSMSEVAEVVGCPLQTAYSRLHAARETLSRAAARHNATGGRQPS